MAGAAYGSPGAAPSAASRRAALSRTLRVRTWTTPMLPQLSPTSGPSGVRARVGFSPNRPQQEAGMRIEPPPSLPCAAGTMPAATAAAAPPDEPPDVRSGFHGLRVVPCNAVSVDAARPISGVLVFPKMTRPVSYTHLRAHETDSYLVCR